MTTPTDADREAAAAYLAALVPTMPLLAERVSQGQTALARAFAAHRLLGQRQGVEMAAKVVKTGMHNEYGRPQPALLAAIRNLAPDAEQ